MKLDPVTLSFAFVLLSIALGVLLIFAWYLNLKVKALAWWGSAFCLIAIGIGIANIGRSSGSYWALLMGNALGMAAYGALYAGCKVFNGRKGFLLPGMAGIAIWIAAFPFIHDMPGARLALVAFLTTIYSAASSWELWRYPQQSLASQRVAVVLLAGLAVFNLPRAWLGFSVTTIPWFDALANRWSSEMALFLVVYAPAQAFIFLSMAKESVEYGYKQAAFVDHLTGIPNRRALLLHASQLLRQRNGKPISCLLFDLDNFKSINDRYGHDAGDRVLSLFGQVLASHLPKQTFGRLGGEEFAAILPMELDQAIPLAETIREAFSHAGKAILGPHAEVSVSVGCSSEASVGAETLLRRADRALYEAKGKGRNLVVAV